MVQSAFSAYRAAYSSAYRNMPRHLFQALALTQKHEYVSQKVERADSVLSALAALP